MSRRDTVIDRYISLARIVGQFRSIGGLKSGYFAISRFWTVFSIFNWIVTFFSLAIYTHYHLNLDVTTERQGLFFFLCYYGLLVKVVSLFSFNKMERIRRTIFAVSKSLQTHKKSHKSIVNNFLMLIFPVTIIYDILDSTFNDVFDFSYNTVIGLARITMDVTMFTVPYLHVALTYRILYLLADAQCDIVRILQERLNGLGGFQYNIYNDPTDIVISDKTRSIHHLRKSCTLCCLKVNCVEEISKRTTSSKSHSNFIHDSEESVRIINMELRAAEKLLVNVDEAAVDFFSSSAHVITLLTVYAIILLIYCLYMIAEFIITASTPIAIHVWTALTVLAIFVVICNATHNFNTQRSKCEINFKHLMANCEDLHDQTPAVRIREAVGRPVIFDLLGFGVLDRAFLLGVVSGVSTYLVIALQFRTSGSAILNADECSNTN
ncbi:Gustatory receptor 87 [Hyalella azteca]|uniref:Gustatory receptor 87 n=1 Tax=Hyalella azteca TaxID=294128 RepID=A0A6A0HD31_HYAAZ|nr:Gustatory receptor 87 [Hyalella azteca]